MVDWGPASRHLDVGRFAGYPEWSSGDRLPRSILTGKVFEGPSFMPAMIYNFYEHRLHPADPA